MTTPMSRRRQALLAAWCTFSVLVVIIIVGGAAGWLTAISLFFVIVSLAVPAYLIATWGPGKAAQEQTFRDTYGSLDGARAALDLDALRTVRDTQGVIPAVRVIRREHPAIPLAQAAEIVRSL